MNLSEFLFAIIAFFITLVTTFSIIELIFASNDERGHMIANLFLGILVGGVAMLIAVVLSI